jgi:hypothetical protein
MLAIFLFTAFLVIRTAPDTFLGRALRRGLVDLPAARLSRLTRGQLVCWLGVALAIWVAIAVFGGDMIGVTARALPETAAWAASFEISTLVDVLITAALIAAQLRLSRVAARLRAIRPGPARRARPRARTPRRRRKPAPKPGNDEDPAPAFARAA